jgi:protocatechuate 3,4-dioxygenase beta subunit
MEVDVGLFFKSHPKHTTPCPHFATNKAHHSSGRQCRFEQLENRELLSVTPIQLGATYLEVCSGSDKSSSLVSDGTEVANLFEVAYTGGADNTKLTSFTIDLGECSVFDVNSNDSIGVGNAYNLKVLSSTGFEVASWNISADGTKLTMQFKDTDGGFNKGEKLVFSVDVDEVLDNSPTVDGVEFVDRTVAGRFWQGASLTGTFAAAHMEDITTPATSFTHIDHYRPADTAEYFTGELSTLLPNADYDNEAANKYMPKSRAPVEGGDNENFVYTAAALANVTQKPLSTISGTVYHDKDGDNVQDSGESGIKNVTITLLNAQNEVVATVSTDENGNYSFKDLVDGTYTVVETQPSNYASVGASTVDGKVATPDKIATIVVDSKDSIDNDFAETKFSLSGYVYFDANHSGTYNSGDSPISGVTVSLYKWDAGQSQYVWVAEQNTTDTGAYSFTDLAPGKYRVVERNKSGVDTAAAKGYTDGSDNVGTFGGENDINDRLTDIVLDDSHTIITTTHTYCDSTAENYNFGELGLTLSGRAYLDIDADGTYDAGLDTDLVATIYLYDANGNKIAETTTASDGTYSFTNLAFGTYSVGEITTWSTYINGDVNVGKVGDSVSGNRVSQDRIAKINLTGDGTNYNFYELLPASLSGRVYYDANGDGVYTNGERGLVTTVTVKNTTDGTVRTVTTNSDGTWAVTGLTAGTYIVTETQPKGYLDGNDTVGQITSVYVSGCDIGVAGNDKMTGVVLKPGAVGVNYNFGELLGATISGYVFQDGSTLKLTKGTSFTNPTAYGYTGTRTSDDTMLSAGVTLALYNAEGKLVGTTSTNSGGYYEFTSLYAGTYSVVLVLNASAYANYYAGIDSTITSGAETVNTYSSSVSSGAQSAINAIGSVVISSTSRVIAIIAIDEGGSSVENDFSEILVQYTGGGGGDVPPPTPWTIPQPPTATPFEPPISYSIPYTVAITNIRLPAGGAGGPGGYTWHLSVIDAGQPREDIAGSGIAQNSDDAMFAEVSWADSGMSQSEFIMADQDGRVIRKVKFGKAGTKPVTGDWDGTGKTKIGVFADGIWFLDLNGDGVWDKGDLWLKLGKKADQPVAGDWNGDGKTDIGIYGPAWIGDLKAVTADPGLPDAQNPPAKHRPKNMPPEPAEAAEGHRTLKRGENGKLRSDLIDHVFEYGEKNDVAVTGDWNGDGIFNVGVFRKGVWYLDMDGDGRFAANDLVIQYGQEGDLPVVGDWTGDGTTKVGVYRNGTFHLDTNNDHKLNAGDKTFQLGRPGDRPVAGDWTGDGIDKVGVYEDGANATQTAAKSEAGTSIK